MAPGIVGFCAVDAKPLGPVQAYVAPTTVAAVSCRVSPAHTAPPLPAAGAAGTAFTVVDAEAELFAEDGSFVEDDTAAVFKAVPADGGAVIATVIAGAAPEASDGRVHVTVVVPLHDQPVPEAETNDAPAGSVSVTDTSEAVEGPAFEIWSVYVIGCPVQIAAGAPLCVTDRSARAKA